MRACDEQSVSNLYRQNVKVYVSAKGLLKIEREATLTQAVGNMAFKG